MALLGEILISIKGTAGQFVSEIKTAEKATGTFIDALDKNKNTLKDISRSFLLASGAMAGALAFAVREAANAERVDARLVQSLRNVGITSTGAATGLSKLATKIEQTSAFGDEDLKTTMATLINMTGSYATALNHTSTVADVARAAQIDLNTAARLVGQAYLGNTAALKRHGIVLKDGMRGMEALTVLQNRFKGASESYTKTFNGQIDSLKNSIGNTAEALGVTMLPALNKYLEKLNAVALKMANMSSEQASSIVKFTVMATAVTGGIGILGTFAGSLVKLRDAFVLARGGAVALFTTLMAHPFVALAVGIAGVVTALGYFGNKIVEDQNKHAAFKASNAGQIEKFTALRDIAMRAGDALVWYGNQQITGTEAVKRYNLILDMLNGKTKTNTELVKKNTEVKIQNETQTKSLTQSLKEAALEMESEKNQVTAYTGSIVSGFNAMTNAVIESNKLTGEELKIGLKAMLNAIVDYYMQQLAAQMAVYISMLFNPITAANAVGGMAATAAQMAILSTLKVGIPMLAGGGIIDRPTLSMIGEGGSPEAVIPLPKLVPIIREAMTTNNNNSFTVIIDAKGADLNDTNWDALVKTKIKPALDRNLRLAGA